MAIESAAESKPPLKPASSNGPRRVLLVAFAVIVSLGILTIYSRFLKSLEQTGRDHPSVGSELNVLKLATVAYKNLKIAFAA